MSSWLVYSSSDSLAYSICIYLRVAAKDAESRTREYYLWTMNTFPLFLFFSTYSIRTIFKRKNGSKAPTVKAKLWRTTHKKQAQKKIIETLLFTFHHNKSRQDEWLFFSFIVIWSRSFCMHVRVSFSYSVFMLALSFFFSYYCRGVIICSACECALFDASRCEMIFCCCFFTNCIFSLAYLS